MKRLIASVKAIIETRKSIRKSQIEKEQSAFQEVIQLFEVSNNENWLSIILKDFLTDQRTMRQKFVSDVEHFHQRDQASLPSTSNQIPNLQETLLSAPDEFSDNELDYDSTELFDFDTSSDFDPADFNEIRSKTQLCDEDIKELSKCSGSYRVMEKALAIGIKAGGGNPNDFAISKASLCDQLSKFRSSKKSENSEGIASHAEKGVLLFDGKKFNKINAKHVGKDSRMVAVYHTLEKDFTLGLPILASGHARSYANELIRLCENNNLTSRVIGLVFDTTIVNTGQPGGVCALYEKDTARQVLNIACRHHIYELLLSTAMTAAIGASSSPTLDMFDSLKNEWQSIKCHGFAYEPCDIDELGSPYLLDLHENAKKALLRHAQSRQIRDDYAELTDLCLKFLGVRTNKTFKVPGAVSRARWMGKAIYGIKTYLFRHELDLEPGFEEGLLQFSLFVSLVYCKYWNRCTNVLDAPINDLSLIADLEQFSIHNADIANSVLNTLWNHLWYFGEELAVLSLFSEKNSIENKNRMRMKLASNPNPIPPRTENSLKLKKYIDGIELPDLISTRSRFLLSLLEIDLNFLNKDAATWKTNTSFKKAKTIIENLVVVVNDKAERALGKATTIIKNQKARSESRFQNMFISL